MFLFYTAWKYIPVLPGFGIAWYMLALSCLAWSMGDATWALFEVFLH